MERSNSRAGSRVAGAEPVKDYDLTGVTSPENRRLRYPRFGLYGLLAFMTLLAVLSILDHLAQLGPWSRTVSGANDTLIGYLLVLPTADAFVIWLCIQFRPYPTNLELDGRGLRLVSAGGGRRSYPWQDPRSTFYLHDARQRTELTKPDALFFECSIQGRRGIVITPLTAEAYDACLDFAQRLSGAVIPVERKAWWGLYGNITLAGEKIYQVRGGTQAARGPIPLR
jgi:hypothetical protein